MALVTLTETQHAALVSGYQRSALIAFAEESKFLAGKIQRDVLAVATQCKALLDAGKPLTVAADHALSATYLATDLARFSTDRMALVEQAATSVYGYTAEETDAIFLVLRAAVERLLATAVDGSTIAADVADVLWQFSVPPSIYS